MIETWVDVCDYESASEAILRWASDGGTYTTCHVNSHTVMSGVENTAHQEAMNGCDLVTPDGSPIVKFLQRKGESIHDRVYGPDLMGVLCAKAAQRGVPIGIYGSRETTLEALARNLATKYPGIQVAYRHSPPFRPLTDEEIAEEDRLQRASGAKIIFVGLGCPKQELYVHGKKQRKVPGVFMAVGAAIDFHAGTVKQAPKWMQNHGLEWLFRLTQDPKRLIKRYAVYSTWYLVRARRQLRQEARSGH